MQVLNKEMYHYHKEGKYDNVWIEGNTFTVDNSFHSFLGNILYEFETVVPTTSGDRVAFDKILKNIIEDDIENIDKDYGLQVLVTAQRILENAAIYNREYALEAYRKLHCPTLPSRLHSIWLCDTSSLKHWEPIFNDMGKFSLYKLLVSGQLFQSSEYFLPQDGICLQDGLIEAYNYWNPSFHTPIEIEQKEYLFQGNVKILEKIK